MRMAHQLDDFIVLTFALPMLQMRPSRRATWKRNNRISLMRYR